MQCVPNWIPFVLVFPHYDKAVNSVGCSQSISKFTNEGVENYQDESGHTTCVFVTFIPFEGEEYLGGSDRKRTGLNSILHIY